MATDTEKLVPYSLLLKPETKKRLRIACLERGTTVPVVMRQLVDEFLEKSA